MILDADVERHLHGADIGRVHENLRHGEPAPFGVVVPDHEAGDPDRVSGVVSAAHGRGACVKSHRGGEYLECRTHLVDALGRPVEADFVIDCPRLVRIEIRQRRHAEDFGSLYVHHQAGRADCTEFFHGDREFVFQHVLNPDID